MADLCRAPSPPQPFGNGGGCRSHPWRRKRGKIVVLVTPFPCSPIFSSVSSLHQAKTRDTLFIGKTQSAENPRMADLTMRNAIIVLILSVFVYSCGTGPLAIREAGITDGVLFFEWDRTRRLGVSIEVTEAETGVVMWSVNLVRSITDDARHNFNINRITYGMDPGWPSYATIQGPFPLSENTIYYFSCDLPPKFISFFFEIRDGQLHILQ